MKTLQKQLVCPTCLEMFTKPVVILPCQHNLCRKCANNIFQAANPVWQAHGSASMSSGGCFRCPSCLQEVTLDRHGVSGLQRNLLVENIIDVYKHHASRSLPPQPEQQQIVCEEHQEEKINIFCLSCQTPSCSLCKVFGLHKDCEVAPILTVYETQKSELSNGIAVLVAENDQIQTLISEMEEVCRNIEDSGRVIKKRLSDSFDNLLGALEERKEQLIGEIGRQQDRKLRHVHSLIRRHGDHQEGVAKLLETASQTMEEPHMAVFIQTTKDILEKMSAAARASTLERPALGYESLVHLTINTCALEHLLTTMDFCSGPPGEEAGFILEEGAEDPVAMELDIRSL
ncbi:tripartite motif-containing protein 54 [Osmerus mordax]|uniref:tripartite motif-containing protein 54 n=1 Tax=Osmerus mordax TaxID=8014 RepID=UPI00350F33E2